MDNSSQYTCLSHFLLRLGGSQCPSLSSNAYLSNRIFKIILSQFGKVAAGIELGVCCTGLVVG